MAERREILPGVETYGAVMRGARPVEVWRMVEAPRPPGTTLVGKDEFVPEAEFKKLTPTEQAYLKKRGVSAFNIEQQRVQRQQVKAHEEAKAFVEREKIAQERWYKENIVEVGPAKEPILKVSFEKLTPTQQTRLKEVGITEFNRPLTGVEIIQTLRSEGRIPADATNIRYDKATGNVTWDVPTPAPVITEPEVAAPLVTTAGVTVPKETASLLSTVWRALTPWGEEKDETFWDYVKGTPRRFISPDIPNQEELAATYEAEQTAPLWSRILFGPTVVKNPRTGEYSPLMLMEYPTGRKAGAVQAARVLTKTVGPREIGMSESQFSRFLKARVTNPDLTPISFKASEMLKAIKPQINWNNIANAIKSGVVKNAPDAARWAAAQTRWFPKTELTPGSPKYQTWMKQLTQQGLKDAATAAAKVRRLDALSKLKVALVPGPGPSVAWEPFRPSELTTSRMKELVTQWSGMKPSDAIRQINDANLVTVAVAYQPEALSRMLSKVTPAERYKTISRLQPATQEAIRVNNLTKAQTLAKTQLKVSTQLAPATATVLAAATQAATEAMTKALTEGKTMTEAQIEAEAAAVTAFQTELQVATELETATVIELESAIQAITQTAVQTATKTPTVYRPVVPEPITGRPPRPARPGESVIITPRIPFSLPSEGEGAARRTTYPDGTIVWRQGAWWKMIPPPYSIKKPLSSRIPPIGVTVTTGTPQETLMFIGGVTPPGNISFDLGVVDGFIDVAERRIVFTGYGEETDVGLRMPSPTRGLTLRHVAPVRRHKKSTRRPAPQVSGIRVLG